MANTNPVFVKPEVFFGPFIKANRVSVANVERLVNFYQGILPGYVDLGLNQLKAAVEVSDIESAQAFAKSQFEAVRVLHKMLVNDSNVLVELVKGFTADYNDVVRESAPEFTPVIVKQAA